VVTGENGCASNALTASLDIPAFKRNCAATDSEILVNATNITGTKDSTLKA